MANVSPRLTFISWAHGAARPVKSAYSGPSASGWTVQNEADVTDLQHKVVASRASNRTHWEARIMAVHGVVETVPRGSSVRVLVNDKTLVEAFISPYGRFIRKNLKRCKGHEFWGPLLELAAAKDIILSVELADAADLEMAQLIEDVQQAASDRLAAMSPGEAIRNAVPPKRRRTKRRLFPPLEPRPPIVDPDAW